LRIRVKLLIIIKFKISFNNQLTLLLYEFYIIWVMKHRHVFRLCVRITFSLLLLIIMYLPASSQDLEIKARVIDSSDLEPVAFSTIFIDDYSGTITDEQGFFRIQISPGKYFDSIHISCVGYLEKIVPINSLNLIYLDSIYLQPNIMELEEVEIQAKSVRAPKSKEIIHLAISRIIDNYPDNSILYNGYYREYIKKNDDYINLFESIIILEDPGFQSIDNFNAGLLYKRINLDFQVDSQLMRPYDNLDKFVPYSRMPIPLNNELVILRAHDPVRNYNRNSLYFIECLETDFIRHHDFSNPKLTYLNDRPYYYITFEDNQKYSIGIDRITASGMIYIDAVNYGIKKINYRATIDKGVNRQKLFELSLEYKLVDETYLLHYLSFNNLFNTRNFALKSTGIFEDQLELTFNKPINNLYAGNPENFLIYLQDQRQEIEKIDLLRTKLYITFSRSSLISEKLKMNLLPRNVTTRKKIAENQKQLLSDLKVEFRDFKDLQGNDIMDHEFNEYYQYREFFTNLINFEHNGITSNLIDKTKPVIENQIFGEYRGDTSWLNTPLIEDSVNARIIYSSNEKLNKFLESLFINDQTILNDIIYIHTDREVYAPEDTVWFKAYILNKKYLTESILSKTFDILLVNSTGKIISQEKYLIQESGVHGQFLLEHTLDEGIYYIVGYSSWMKNFDPGTLFSKKIMVLNDKQVGFRLMATSDKQEYFPGDTMQLWVNCYDDFKRNVDDVSFSYRFVSGRDLLQKGRGNTSVTWLDPVLIIIPPYLDTIPEIELRSTYKSQILDTVFSLPVNHSIQINFFPEGGYCINGIETKIAFKALTINGNPVEIKGDIIDQDGKVLATTESLHDGMGVFSYTPQENRLCYFQLTQPAVLNKKFLLPEGKNEGWHLHIKPDYKNSNEIELEISNVNTENDTALITLMIRGYLCYYKIIKIGKKRSVKIPTGDLPHGIAVLTVFNSKLLPQAERLICIYPEYNYSMNLLTDRNRYIPRDSVILSVIPDGDRALINRGSYSLSVIDNQLCTSNMLDEPDIKSSLLLSSEIHGKIHRPNDYFDDSNENAREDLDLLLMTQGWRNYLYPDKNNSPDNIIIPSNRDVISGRLVKQPFGSESKATDGLLRVLFGGNTNVIPVEKDGEFSFLPEYSSEFNTGVFMYAEDKNGKSNLSIMLNSSAFENELTEYLKYLSDSLIKEPVKFIFNQDGAQDHFSLSTENHRWLEEVIIVKTIRKKELDIKDLAFNKRTATQDELDMAGNMEILESFVRKPNPDGFPIYYCIDGLLQFTYYFDGLNPPVRVPDYSYAYTILPEEISEYTVIEGPDVQALYGWGIEYIIDVKTKPSSERGESWKWKNPVNIEKFAVAKEFYNPVYDTEEKRSSFIPDLRKTILWEPELQLEEDGTAEIKFYNGDRYTRIKCVLEGITEEGVPVHAEQYYDVTLTRE
jgi:hypothetical protein